MERVQLESDWSEITLFSWRKHFVVWPFVALAWVAILDPYLVAERPWPFTPPGEVEPPSVESTDWIRNGIDAFVLARLEATGLRPAPEATKRTLLRRVYFDLIGLPPTPEEVTAFLSDREPDAYEEVVDRLLEDTRYGERWARYWLDLARYADTAGYEGDPDLPHAWRYRDYVIDAFNDDKPYDMLIKEQLAGDELDEVMGAGDLPETPAERVVALTFLRLAPFTEPRGDETRHEMLSEITSTVGSVFLGLTVGCAKCHDHKYDRIPTKDFYRMKAFFATVSIPRPLPGDIYQIGGPLPAEFYRAEGEAWADQKRAAIKQEAAAAKEKLAALVDQLKKRASSQDDIEQLLDNPKVTSLAERARYKFLNSRERFSRQQLQRLEPLAMSLRHSYGPPYEPGVPTSRIMIRGEYDNPGEVVEPGYLSCITGNQDAAPLRLDPFKRWPTRSRRMALANWIASPENPLTARVMVNRLWHWHFGRGIVSTPSDFGQLSGGPSHRGLLDWLANEFVNHGWSVKAMHRLMVTSSTYRQKSVNPTSQEAGAVTDPDNRLLWHYARRRLDAEAIRDAVLAVSGRLNPESGGLPIFPPLPDDIAETVKYSESKWDTQTGAESRKRSLYIYQQRTLTMPLMQTFDALVCDESRPRRRSSVTPLQALAMLNGNLVHEEARHFADRVRREAGDDTTEQIQRAFQLALSRPPTSAEKEYLLAFLKSENDTSTDDEGRLTALCRVLYNANEFIYID